MDYKSVGSHSKSDWILYKKSAPEVEVYASRNDVLNLTKAPKELMDSLEEDTQYNLKLRYFDSTNSVWSDYGSLDFTTKATFPKTGLGTIGIPGEMGFGVGVCPDADVLEELGMTPLEGCDDPNNDNYGNYQQTTSGIYVYIPAFCYSFDSSDITEEAKRRSPDNAMYIKSAADFNYDEAAMNEAGYILHRAFIDGGQVKHGFFIAKYIASRDTNGLAQIPMSVKKGKIISLSTDNGYTPSSEMSGCSGNLSDALVLAKKVGASYHCETAFQASALAMLALCHGQYATDTAACGWYDAKGTTNYPKGCNNGRLGDYNDSSVKYTHSGEINSAKPLAGSGTPFAKTTHNGQANGVSDVNGSIWQATIGCDYYNSKYSVFKESVAASSITKDNVSTASNYDNFTYSKTGSYKWGVQGQCCFYKDTSGVNRALCGVLPPENSTDSTGTNEFGQDYVYVNSGSVLFVANYWNNSASSGVFCRDLVDLWTKISWVCGFRVSAYGSK